MSGSDERRQILEGRIMDAKEEVLEAYRVLNEGQRRGATEAEMEILKAAAEAALDNLSRQVYVFAFYETLPAEDEEKE